MIPVIHDAGEDHCNGIAFYFREGVRLETYAPISAGMIVHKNGDAAKADEPICCDSCGEAIHISLKEDGTPHATTGWWIR